MIEKNDHVTHPDFVAWDYEDRVNRPIIGTVVAILQNQHDKVPRTARVSFPTQGVFDVARAELTKIEPEEPSDDDLLEASRELSEERLERGCN